MKLKRRFSFWFRIHFHWLLWKYTNVFVTQIKYNFLWIWRFLFTWGWNGKKNTFSVSFYEEDMETEIWTIGDY